MRASVALGALVLLACRSERESQPRATAEPARERPPCIADRIDDLRVLDRPLRGGCEPEDLSCVSGCLGGDANACFNRALALQRVGREDEAVALFEHGCELGDAISCVNYGAAMWVSEPDDEILRCAERLFQRTCDAGQQIGCGMRGRVMIDLAKGTAEVANVRAYLENTCERVKGFACRVLAYHLERGDFGDFDPAQIPRLLARACEGGDPDACGEPKTADETFY